MKNQRKKKRIIFVAGTFAISLLALIFVISNFRDNMVFFYAPSELLTPEILHKIKSRQIRVGGLVEKNSVKKIDALTTEFVVTDMKKTLKINYIGMLPDLFREDQGIVAKGEYDVEKQMFFSRELLVKHDENYMPPEVANSLEK